jgi:hypothetical protein
VRTGARRRERAGTIILAAVLLVFVAAEIWAQYRFVHHYAVAAPGREKEG